MTVHCSLLYFDDDHAVLESKAVGKKKIPGCYHPEHQPCYLHQYMIMNNALKNRMKWHILSTDSITADTASLSTTFNPAASHPHLPHTHTHVHFIMKKVLAQQIIIVIIHLYSMKFGKTCDAAVEMPHLSLSPHSALTLFHAHSGWE